MSPFGETIAVIDKSGKVVSTSKHLFGVFSHAKNAYRERKAQVQSERNAKIAEREALRALQNYHIDDAPSVAPSRRSRSTHSRHHSGRSQHHRHHRPPSQYGSQYEPQDEPQYEQHYEQDRQSVASRPDSFYAPPSDMVRRHTHHDLTVREPEPRPPANRSKSEAHIDLDLAYGEFHPSAMTKGPSPQQQQLQRIEDPELNGLVGRAQWLLEEANCVHHTATATIAHLQKNPDAMAAVALTLAEISNLATKMAPAALSVLKSAAPTIFALLASPQFLIAAGVGLGVTIVMFGGYKIIKQISSATGIGGNEVSRGPEEDEQTVVMEEMIEFDTDCLSGVEMWRRGVADAEAGSLGTSVDGEFITPTAAAMSGIDITTARMMRDPRFKFNEEESVASSRRSRRSRAPRSSSRQHHYDVDARTESYAGSKAPSVAPSRAPSNAFSKAPSKAPSRAPSKAESRHSDRDKKPKEKKKRSSRLRLMFTA
ncbi:uncharacterized protein ACLA_090200 [Aspergillus clavatus NRRL 1]|uniref:Uncharacterized protein n=1 Tax=Aspergillus clavatus (strain ATCC 1007 / CBS 513.65 / DSM 816 / NCTC 3887 / NRRL 1 / QM 1276 / 107) TaxID=344612 RepID=A1CEM8_ASPCL|nr:uncharacterized protein ACLA_090200 [Aspergillus clavatus NRRL 1]EAW11327.1 conserved hypothetical protein [Aspergillus clavatus NRRL 1]